MDLDDLAAENYTLKNENERLRAHLKAAKDAIMAVEHHEFGAHKTPLWLEGFTCAKVACAASLDAIDP